MPLEIRTPLVSRIRRTKLGEATQRSAHESLMQDLETNLIS